MNSPSEQSEACSHDCEGQASDHEHKHVHGACEKDCAPAAAVQAAHAPEGFFSRVVGLMDIAGVFASAVCTVHCLLLPFVIALLPVLASPILEHDYVHMGLAGFVLVFCLVAFIPGYMSHGDKRLIYLGSIGVSMVFFATFVARAWGELAEASIITAGNAFIICGHLLNRKLIAHLKCKHH